MPRRPGRWRLPVVPMPFFGSNGNDIGGTEAEWFRKRGSLQVQVFSGRDPLPQAARRRSVACQGGDVADRGPDQDDVPSWRETVVRSLVIGLSWRTSRTSTVPMMSSPAGRCSAPRSTRGGPADGLRRAVRLRSPARTWAALPTGDPPVDRLGGVTGRAGERELAWEFDQLPTLRVRAADVQAAVSARCRCRRRPAPGHDQLGLSCWQHGSTTPTCAAPTLSGTGSVGSAPTGSTP
jgi:hypothetical protein